MATDQSEATFDDHTVENGEQAVTPPVIDHLTVVPENATERS